MVIVGGLESQQICKSTGWLTIWYRPTLQGCDTNNVHKGFENVVCDKKGEHRMEMETRRTGRWDQNAFFTGRWINSKIPVYCKCGSGNSRSSWKCLSIAHQDLSIDGEVRYPPKDYSLIKCWQADNSVHSELPNNTVIKRGKIPGFRYLICLDMIFNFNYTRFPDSRLFFENCLKWVKFSDHVVDDLYFKKPGNTWTGGNPSRVWSKIPNTWPDLDFAFI